MTMWMLYAVFIGVVLACAASVLERAAAQLRMPRRYIWAGSLAVLVSLAAWAPLRSSGGELVLPADVVVATAPSPLAAEAGEAWAGRLRATLERPLIAAAARLPQVEARMLAALWAALSVLVACGLCATLVHYRTLRRRWVVRYVAGSQVRVAPASGPAVFGVVRPEIVVPEWLLAASPAQQQLVLEHEREHVNAGDPALLAAGCLGLVLLPWNPAVWWILGRLRLAVELDCDARVLRRGAEPLLYGTLLVEIAGRGRASPYGAAALADRPSQLERRLHAMTERTPRLALARGGALGVTAAALVLLACETALPTAAEIEAMDANAAAQLAAAAGVVAEDAPRYFVDGVEVERDAVALAPDAIARMEVVRRHALAAAGLEGSAPAILITTTAEAARQELAERERRDATAAAVVRTDPSVRVLSESDFNGLLLIDGVRAEPSAMRRLAPDAIDRVEITKGAAAQRLFPDPRAAHGVIHITTKQP